LVPRILVLQTSSLGSSEERGFRECRTTYIYEIVQFYSARAIKLDFLQGCADGIVRLVLELLGDFDGGSFVKVALVFGIESLEVVLELEDFVLAQVRVLPCQLDDIHDAGTYAYALSV
jgi:hypothetical protein